MNAEIQAAMWDGDEERLHELAPCVCCCGEHTHEGCPARAWHGCRGQGTMTRAEEEAWAAHYQEAHGLTRARFFNVEDEESPR